MNYSSTHLKMLKRVLSVFLIWTFGLGQVMPMFPSNAYAQGMLPLPVPGTMVTVSPSFAPPIIRGITIYPDNPFRFDFIVDTGDHNLQGQALEQESTKMIKYFLASLTVPEDEFWVNLSPYEKDRIIPDGLGVTELGRDLLAQDYILKQITASLMYPEENLGSAFWKRVYEKAKRLYGTTDIPVNTFNKVWIIPDRAVVYEHERGAFVGERHLKVMLEEDYFALQEEMKSNGIPQGSQVNENKQADDKTSVVSEMIREVLIPELEKEVNEGEHFANLRQIFNAMILATWYKQVLKESLLGQIYVDQNKVKGVDVEDKEVKQKIYDQYVEAFKQGVYDYIKEDIDPVTQEMIPKRYFSGGVDPGVVNVKDLKRQDLKAQPLAEQEKIAGPESGNGNLVIVESGATVVGQEVPAQPAGEKISDEAMLVKLTEGSIDKKGNNIVIKRPYAKSVSMSIEDAQEFVKDLIDQSKVLSPEFISFSLQVNSSRSSQAAAILSVLSHEAGLDDITTSEGFRRDYAREEYERVETVKDQSPNKEKLQAAKRFLNKFNRVLNQTGDQAMLAGVITSLEEIKKDISQKGEFYNRTAEEYTFIAVSDESIEAMLESARLRLQTVTDELSRLRSLPKEDHDKLVAAGTGISGALSRYFTAIDNLYVLKNGLNAQRVFSREINDKRSEVSYAINDLKIKLDSMPISDAAMLTLKNDKRVVISNVSDSFTIDDVLRTLEGIQQEATRSYERGGLVVFGTPSNARFLLMDMAQESGKFEGMWRDTHLDQWKIPGDQAESFRTWLNNQITFLQEALTTKNIDALNAKEGFDLQMVSENRVDIPDGEKTYSASVKETIRVMEEIIASLTQQPLDKDGFVRYIAGDTKFVLMNAIEKSGKFGIRFGSHLQQWNVPKENIRSLSDWMQAELDMIKEADTAMLTRDGNEKVGGIDFNPAMLEMQIKRDGNGLVLPVSEQPILNMNIEGLVPIIINVLPVTVPMLLGELEEQEPAKLSRVN